MTAENDPIASGPNMPPVIPPANGDAAPPQPHRRKRGLVLKIATALVILVVLLIALAPTLIGTGPVVSVILGQVNKQLDGKVTIDSLSLGWFGGVDVKGVHIFDAANMQIASLDHAAVPLPLWKAAIGSYALGNVVVEGITFDERIDAQGHSNFEKLLKPSQPSTPTTTTVQPASTPSKPSTLPNLSGNIKLVNCHGTVSQEGKPTVSLNKLEAEVKIPDINQPITETLMAVVKVGDQPQGQITVNGTASVIKSNQIAIDTADVHQTIDAQNFSLAAGKPFLPADLLDTLDGVLGAHVAVDLAGGKSAVLDVLIDGTQKISVGGKVLHGDTFSTKELKIVVPRFTADFPDGAAHWQSAHIAVGSTQNQNPIRFHIDQGDLTAGCDLIPQALLHLGTTEKPGSAGQLSVEDNFDLAAFARQLPHLLNTPAGVTINTATLNQTIKLAWTAEKPSVYGATDINNVRGQRTTASGGVVPIALEPIHLEIAGDDLGGGHGLPDQKGVGLKLTSKFANADFKGPSLGDIKGKLHVDLKMLKDELGQLIDLQNVDLDGAVDADLTSTGQLGQAPFLSTIQLLVQGNGLKYLPKTGSQINQPFIRLDLNAELHGGDKSAVQTVKNLAITLKSGDPAAPVTDLSFTSPSIDLTNGITAHYQLSVPDLKQTFALADTISAAPEPPIGSAPVANTAKPASASPAPKPLVVDSGTISINGDLSRDAHATKFDANLSGQNISFHRDQVAYTMKPVTAKAAGDMTTEGAVTTIHITDLNGDLGIANLSTPGPITLTQSSANSAASGSIKITGTLTDLTQFLSAYQGEKPAALPYRGDYTLTENIGSKEKTLALQGGIDIAKFQVYDGSTITFAEDLLSIANDLAYVTVDADPAVNINSLTVSMKSSGAANVSLTKGSVQKLNSDRIVQLHPMLDYDLAKLWPIVQPMMGEKYKTLKITGHYQKQFNVTGSYPANQPSTVAVRTVKADGDLAVESFDYDGLNIKNLIVPITLADGKLTTVYIGKPAGQNTAPAAVANDGTMDVGDLTIDLTQEPPRLTTPANKTVISKLTINPLFAGTFLKNIINNPLFAGDESATGLVDLAITDCTELPLGSLVMQALPANTGKIDLLLSMTKLNVSVGNAQLAKYLGAGSFEADVNNGTIAVAKGVSTQHIKFVSGSYALSFDGSVRLKDQAFIPMTLGFPLKTIAEKTHFVKDQNVINVLPDEISVPVEGTVNAPSFRFDKVIGKVITDSTGKAIAGGLLGGGNKNNKNGNADAIGNLFNKLIKKKKDPNNNPQPHN